MLHMLLKYIHSIFLTTCFNHSFFEESISLHTISLVHLRMSLFINFVFYGVPSSYFLFFGCSVHQWVCLLSVVCVLICFVFLVPECIYFNGM
jgi:hypothetical protein